MEELIKEIIRELLETPLSDLLELRETWIADVKRKGVSSVAVHFCEAALELVILKKMKEEGAAV